MEEMKSKKCLFSDSHWEKFEGSRWSSRACRIVLEAFLLSGTNAFLTLAIQFRHPRWLYIMFFVVCLVLYLLALAHHAAFLDYLNKKAAKKDDEIKHLQEELSNLRNLLIDRENDINGCEEAFSSIQATVELSANNINRIRHLLMSSTEITSDVWNFKQICAVICKNTFDVLTKLYHNDKDFEVSYVSFKALPSGEHVSKMLCYETRRHEAPSIYDTDILLPKNLQKMKKKEILQRYCFEKLYLENTKAPLILLSEAEIVNNFKFKSDDQKNACKYKQYIGIPVCCNAKKMIGVLQIASFQDNLIKGDLKTVNQVLITLLRPLSYLSLLANKTQDCFDLFTKGAQNEKKTNARV